MEASKDLKATISASTIKKKNMDKLIDLVTNEKEYEEEAGSEKDESRSEEEDDNFGD